MWRQREGRRRGVSVRKEKKTNKTTGEVEKGSWNCEQTKRKQSTLEKQLRK